MESSTPTSQKFESELGDFEGAVEHSEDGIANWRSLFNFTTRHHVPNLLFAVFFSIISAFLKPTGAIFYGKIFTVLINFGTGILSPNEALRQISQWCIALVILGAISWPIEGAFLSLWITFGELQAKSIREKMFESMLEKGMDWYDLRQDGIASLMTRMQT
jgi:ATP-binding cassette subfamily B (MDR/TAP) protein 1